MRDYVMKMMEDLVSNTVEPIVLESKYPEEWDFETLNRNLRRIIKSYERRTEYETDELAVMTGDSLKVEILDEFEKLYEEKEREIGEERMREVERMILLRVVDNLWMDQIDAMDQLKEGIGLRALGQQDPVAAYAQEGFEMFDSMINEIKNRVFSSTLSARFKAFPMRRCSSIRAIRKRWRRRCARITGSRWSTRLMAKKRTCGRFYRSLRNMERP